MHRDGQHDASDLDVTVGVRSVVLGQDGRSAGYEKFTQRAGTLLDRAAEVGPIVSAFLRSLERTAINEVAELG